MLNYVNSNDDESSEDDEFDFLSNLNANKSNENKY
jgi:hypothetical protein